MNGSGNSSIRRRVATTTTGDRGSVSRGRRVTIARSCGLPSRAATTATCLPSTLRNEVNALLQSSVNIRNPTYPDPYGGLSPQAFVTVSATPNVSITSDRHRAARIESRSTCGLSRELRPSLAVHVDLVYSKRHEGQPDCQRQHARPGDRRAPSANVGEHPRIPLRRRERLSRHVSAAR